MFIARAVRSAALANEGVTLADSGGLRVALVSILPAALAISATVLAAMKYRMSRHSGSTSPSDVIPLLISCMLLVLFCNPMANTRFISILAFGTLALILLRPLSNRAGQLFAVVAVFGTAVVYPLADIFRHGLSNADTIQTGLQAFSSNDFDGFQQIANGIVYVEDNGLSWGRYTLSAIFYFIPRSLWGDKSIPASIDVAANRGYNFTNLSLPFPAEMYVEFGLVGSAMALFALGWFCGRVDNSWLKGLNTKLAILAPVIALAMLGFIRGPLGSLVPVYLSAILLVFLGLSVRPYGGSTKQVPVRSGAKFGRTEGGVM